MLNADIYSVIHVFKKKSTGQLLKHKINTLHNLAMSYIFCESLTKAINEHGIK